MSDRVKRPAPFGKRNEKGNQKQRRTNNQTNNQTNSFINKWKLREEFNFLIVRNTLRSRKKT